MSHLLEVRELTVSFSQDPAPVRVLRKVDLAVSRAEFVGLVGESGCGKSLTALSILGLLPPGAEIESGSILLHGEDLLAMSDSEMRSVRGARIALVFQEPMTALNPVFTVGFQIAEAVRAHRDIERAAARREAERLLDLVAMPDAARRLDDYPHQLSGGQRQRALIAMALAAEPELLIADEPTTALDMTIQAQILELLESLRRELDLAVLLITHDLGVVAETCDRVVVMYAGQIVEEAEVASLFAAPAHPYTRGLLAAVPRLAQTTAGQPLATIPGQPPDPSRLPAGCAFHPRCAEVLARCDSELPPVYTVGSQHEARCFLHAERES